MWLKLSAQIWYFSYKKLMLILAFEILNGVVTSKIALFCLWSNVQTWIYIYYNIFMIWVREEHKLHFSSGLRYATQKPGSVTIHSLNWVLNIFLGWFWVPDQFNHHQQNSLFSNVMHHCTFFKKINSIIFSLCRSEFCQ